jgi:hypothetical protein
MHSRGHRMPWVAGPVVLNRPLASVAGGSVDLTGGQANRAGPPPARAFPASSRRMRSPDLQHKTPPRRAWVARCRSPSNAGAPTGNFTHAQRGFYRMIKYLAMRARVARCRSPSGAGGASAVPVRLHHIGWVVSRVPSRILPCRRLFIGRDPWQPFSRCFRPGHRHRGRVGWPIHLDRGT